MDSPLSVIRSARTTPWLLALCALVVAVAATFASPPASVAATESLRSASTCGSTGWVSPWTTDRQLTVAPFDPTVGRLVDIEVSVTAEATTSYRIESIAADPRRVVIARGGTMDTTIPGSPGTTAEVVSRVTANLDPADGALDYAGVSGASGALPHSNVTSVVHPNAVGAWTGTDLVPIVASSTLSTALHHAGDVLGDTTTSSKLTACVIYTYEHDTSSCVAGRVWADADADGIQGLNEAGVPGTRVTIFDVSGAQLAAVTTDAAGRWTACGLEPGRTCSIELLIPYDRTLAPRGAGDDRALDSDATERDAGVAQIACTPPADGLTTTYDAGLAPSPTTPASAASSPTYVSPRARNLLVSIRARTPEVQARTAQTFTVWVRNPTIRTRTNVQVCHIAAPQFVFGAQVRKSTQSQDKMCWSIARLAPGAGRVYHYRMRAMDVSQRRCTRSAVTVTQRERSVPLSVSTRTCVVPRARR